jgi:NADPH:quinone reductase-like Zn-dependent oxidoreductase
MSSRPTMRAITQDALGGPEVLQLAQVPRPEPLPTEVLVRVHSAGVNPVDWKTREGGGMAGALGEPPFILGWDVSGVVEEVGFGVHTLEVGDEVYGMPWFPRQAGAYAEYVTAPSRQFARKPTGLDHDRAAAMPLAALTAWQSLVDAAHVEAGQRVLIHAAAGGVGIAATQIAKLIGAEVYGTASPAKHDAIRGFGVDHPIDYRTHDVVDEVRRIAGEEHPIDIAFDAIGGRSFRQSFALLRAGGRLVCFGASEVQAGERRSPLRALRVLAQMPRFNPLKLMRQSKSVIGLNMLTLWDERESIDDLLEPLRDWIAAGALRPVVAQEFRLDDGAAAHRYMHERHNVGKVVLTL